MNKLKNCEQTLHLVPLLSNLEDPAKVGLQIVLCEESSKIFVEETKPITKRPSLNRDGPMLKLIQFSKEGCDRHEKCKEFDDHHRRLIRADVEHFTYEELKKFVLSSVTRDICNERRYKNHYFLNIKGFRHEVCRDLYAKVTGLPQKAVYDWLDEAGINVLPKDGGKRRTSTSSSSDSGYVELRTISLRSDKRKRDADISEETSRKKTRSQQLNIVN